MQRIEQQALKIVRILRKNGYKVYYAGGSVRDKLLGLPFKDIDIATSAQPNEIMSIFKRTVPVGVQFGVVMVLMENIPFEVATFRKDGIYKDGRHPESVEFTDEKEDALRRDFTINGLFYDPITDQIIDYVKGKKDIAKGIIRAIGDPIKRFNDDKLRLMRAIRFAARFSYTIEQTTWHSIKTLHKEISQVSVERIRDELLKILTQNKPHKGIQLLDESGLLKVILPEVTQLKGVQQPKQFHPEGDVYTHTLIMLENMKNPSDELALAVLLHDIGKPPTFVQADRIRFNGHDKLGASMTKTICERLKMSNRETNHVVELVKQHLYFMNVQKMRESKLKRFLRQDHFDDHLELHRLDCLASHGKLDHYEFCINKLKEYSTEEDHLNPPKLVNGNKLIELGYKPGPHFKKMLEEIENAQLEGKIKTEAEAIDYIKSYNI